MTADDLHSGRSGLFGDYASWNEAVRDARGHEAEKSRQQALERLARSMERWLEGEVAYCRDGVELDRLELPYPLLAHLLAAAIEDGGRLALVDFGGALGTTYHQTRGFLAGLRAVRWAIVELPEVVACGRARFTTAELSFHDSIAEAQLAAGATVALLSGVYQYLAEPEAILAAVRAGGFRHVVFDRTPIVADGERPRIMLQAVPGPEGEISWPCRLTTRRNLLQAFEPDYELVDEFDSYCDPSGAIDGLRIDVRGLVLRRRAAPAARPGR